MSKEGSPEDPKRKRIGEALSRREARVSEILPCSLEQYRDIVSNTPKPTEKQIENLVQFVSSAHSWYKHLLVLPPGIPFIFFVDPMVGCDRMIHPESGEVRHKERTEDSQKFHYTWMTTAEYRERFACLSYHCAAGVAISLSTSSGIAEYANRPIFVDQEQAHRIPSEIVEQCSAELTGVIHPDSAQPWIWLHLLENYITNRETGQKRRWPEETGGDETFRKIMEFCHREEVPSE